MLLGDLKSCNPVSDNDAKGGYMYRPHYDGSSISAIVEAVMVQKKLHVSLSLTSHEE
jgi:hypothetical protein